MENNFLPWHSLTPCVARVAALLSSASGSVVHESAALIPSAERRTEYSTAHAQGRTARCLSGSGLEE